MGEVKKYWRKMNVSSLDGCISEYRLFETFVGDENEDYRSNIESEITISQYKDGDLLFNDGNRYVIISVDHLKKFSEIINEAVQYAESISNASV